MKGKELSRTRLWIATVTELRLDAGAFVGEWERIAVVGDAIRQEVKVVLSLHLDTAESCAYRLGFNDSCSLAVMS